MQFDQVFYGRGRVDYDVLASSAGDDVVCEVKSICEGIQTPRGERPGDNVPFLFQKRFKTKVLMGCGREGAIDPYGRKTLFYHVLVADAGIVRKLSLSAANLYRADAFASTLGGHDVKPLEFDEGLATKSSEAELPCSISSPAVIVCRRSENLKLLDLIGAQLVNCDWATMSWSRLPGFDFCGLDKSCNLSRIPEHVHVYGIDGDELNIERIKVKVESGALSQSQPDPEAKSVRSRLVFSPKVVAALSFVSVMIGFAMGMATIPRSAVCGQSATVPPKNGSENVRRVKEVIGAADEVVRAADEVVRKFNEDQELQYFKDCREKRDLENANNQLKSVLQTQNDTHEEVGL